LNRKTQIYLYSSSPRRAELLSRAGINFLPFPVDADESLPSGCSREETVCTISRRKLDAGLRAEEKNRLSWGLAADTLVDGPEGFLGKPGNRKEASEMLRLLSGTTHRVYTGISVYSPDNIPGENPISISHSTDVEFRRLTRREITEYVNTGEWQGAAGAYRIQEKGAFLIRNINGLWSTVVGLPLSPLYGILTAMSYPFG